jgi:tetratricopeptide (TPR) repeat protein
MGRDRIGKYRIVGRIGQGAMGEVYRAQDPLLNRFVALKTISPSLSANAEFRERFLREARSAAALGHPNIVTIFDFGEEDGLSYMAMELLEGTDLREAIRARSLGHLGRRLAVMEQLAEGLAFAHGRGVVHRDLKPANVHLQPDGSVKILDFGLARIGTSDMTRTGTVMGTPHYMSPEQVRGERADARSDVFSLGGVFFEVLTYARAFEAPSVDQVLRRIVDGDKESLHRLAPDVPAPLLAVVERALEKDPDRRFDDAGRVVEALARARDALAGETLVLPPRAGDAEATVVLLSTSVGDPRGPGSAAGGPDPGFPSERARSPRAGARGGERSSPARARLSAPRRARSRLFLLAVAATAAAAGGVLWWTRTQGAPGGPRAEAPAREQVDILTDALVTSKIEIARADLENRDYASAAANAEEAIRLAPSSVDARDVLERARRIQRDLEDAVRHGQEAVRQGDTAAGSEALARIFALDPTHPAAASLSKDLNRFFRAEAEEARSRAREARVSAGRAQATSLAGFAAADRVSATADDLFRRQQYADATRLYLESRNGFEATCRQAEADQASAAARRTAAAPRPSPSPPLLAPAASSPPQASPVATPSPAVVMERTPGADVTVAGTAATPSPIPNSVPPLPATPPPAEVAVRQVVADYGRAIETQDLALYRSVRLSLTADEEKRLRQAFASVRSQEVLITIEAVEVVGDRAVVRATRLDTVDGRTLSPRPTSFTLYRDASGTWRIEAIGR